MKDNDTLSEDECLTMQEFCEEQGLDSRVWDPNYVCIRRAETGRYSRPGVYVRKETLLDPLRIEKLRWKAYLNLKNGWEATFKLKEEVCLQEHKECFIPPDLEAVSKIENISEEEVWQYSQPRRVSHQETHGLSDYITYDDDFWIPPNPKHDEQVAMEVIAAAAVMGDWDHKTLPDRLTRSQDPVKLALGARWHHTQEREAALLAKCHDLNKLLARAILCSELLPKSDLYIHKMVRVHMNERIYYFKTGRGHKAAEYDLWPEPADLTDVYITGKIKPAGT